MRYKFLFLVCLLLIAAVWSESTCPRPRVRKRTIILSNESLNNGARLISNEQVASARQCYDLCCKDTTCNVAVMHYKQKKNELDQDVTAKYCFLFDCGSPSVCTYEYHRRYAIIDLPTRRKLPSFTTTAATTPTTSTPSTEENKSTDKVKGKVPTKCIEACPYDYDPVCGSDGKSYDNRCLFKLAQCKEPSIKLEYEAVCRECPPGTPVASCSDDPCTLIKCPAHKDAVCKANFCGGCNAVYSNSDGVKVNCTLSDVVVSNDHNEQSVTVGETDYTETPEDSLPIDKTHAVEGKKGDEGSDPYYNSERRHWLSHNHTGGVTTAPISNMPVVVVVSDSSLGSSLMSLPLLIALIICIILLIGVIYRVKCVQRGRAKKLPVDDGDYLINGMYL